MTQHFGVELEMVMYAKEKEALNETEKLFEEMGFEVSDDGSLYSDREVDEKIYPFRQTYEMKSCCFSDYKAFLKDLRKIIMNKEYKITINEDGGDIRIDFNNSTGTHIHYSSEMSYEMKYYNEEYDEEQIGEATQELEFIDEEIAIKMRDYIYGKLHKYPSIQQACYRSYSSKEIYKTRRESCINISNERGHGTIEFRLFNLRGIKTKEFLKVLGYEIRLVKRAIKLAYRLGVKKLEKDYTNKLSSLRKYYLTL
jgi:hypothetical protein